MLLACYLASIVCTLALLVPISTAAATPTSHHQEDDNIDRYLVATMNGTSSIPCGRLWLPLSEQPCSDLLTALVMATSLEYAHYRQSDAHHAIIVTILDDIYSFNHTIIPSINVTVPYNITIMGQLSSDDSGSRSSVVPSLHVTAGSHYSLHFIGSIHLTIINLRVIRQQLPTLIDHDSIIDIPDGQLTMNNNSTSSSSLTLINVEFTGHVSTSSTPSPSKGVMISCNCLTSAMIINSLFHNAYVASRSDHVIMLIGITHNSVIDIINTTITNNIMSTGGAVMKIVNGDHYRLDNVIISHNLMYYHLNGTIDEQQGIPIGGALQLLPSNDTDNTISITRSMIVNNTIDIEYMMPLDPQDASPHVHGFVSLVHGGGIGICAHNISLIHIADSQFMMNTIHTPAITTRYVYGAGLSMIVPQLFNASHQSEQHMDGVARTIIINDCSFMNNHLINGDVIGGAALYMQSGRHLCISF
jgi:hypothetical protein